MKSASLRNQNGDSLIMVLIAVAITGIATAGIVTLMGNMQDSTNTTEFRNNANVINEEVRALLSSPAACLNSLGFVTNVTVRNLVPRLKDSVAADKIIVGQSYEHNTATIAELALDSFVREGASLKGYAVLGIQLQSNKRTIGGPKVYRSVNIAVTLNASNAIIECVALAKMSDGIWTRTTADLNNIYFLGPGTSGRVAIGTSTPTTALEVSGNGNGSVQPDFPAVRISNTYPTMGGTGTDNVAAVQVFAGNSAVQGQIHAQFAPVANSTNGAFTIWAKSALTPMVFLTSHSSGAYSEKMRLAPNGFLGIANTNPTAALDVTGNGKFSGTLALGGSATGPAFITPSDKRLKDHIRPLSEERSEHMKDLQIYTFAMKNDPSHRRHLGVIAQETANYFPEAVEQSEDGHLAVNYPMLIAPLTKFAQSTRALVENLALENQELRRRLEKLEAKRCSH